MQDRRWKAALDEQRRIMQKHGDELNMDVLSEMEELHVNIQEAVRLFPPLILVMRYVRETFSVTDSGGRQFVIPKVLIALL